MRLLVVALGIKFVDLGEDLQAGTAIVSLQSIDELKVDFPISQKWLTQIATGLDVEISYLESDNLVATGIINAIGAKVDDVTRSILVQATLRYASCLSGRKANALSWYGGIGKSELSLSQRPYWLFLLPLSFIAALVILFMC